MDFFQYMTRVIIGIGCLMLVWGCGLFVYSYYTKQHRIAIYQAHLEQWKNAKIATYKLQYSNKSQFSFEKCAPITVFVKDGMPQVVNQMANESYFCSSPGFLTKPKPMENLFANLIQMATQSKLQCGANGCLCDGIVTTHVSFDEKLGYIRTVRETSSGLFTPQSNEYFSLSITCTSIGGGLDAYSIQLIAGE